tara:strand:- start:2269 stop:2769 length:501 start_codon:yes stop_codon:yes gene_type:complete
MGHRPNAEIFFGVFLGNEGCWHRDQDWGTLLKYLCSQDEFENAVAAVGGVQPFDLPYEGNENAWSEWYDRKKEAVEACPIKLVLGGALADDVVDSSLAIKETSLRSDWDDNPKTLSDEMILKHGDVQEACWGGELKEWVEKLGISWRQIERANPEGPRWLLVTSHG